MKKVDFLKNLHNNGLPRAMLFYGNGHFLTEHYISQIAKQVATADETLKMYHDEYDFSRAKEHLAQNSLFGDKNLLIIRSEKKIPASDIKTLLSLVQKSETNYFLYGYFGTDTKSVQTPFVKKNGAENLRVYPPSSSEAKTFLSQYAGELNVNIDGYALHHLLNTQNGDISLALNELKKLAILDRQISVKEIDDLVYPHLNINLDDLLLQLLQRKNYTQNLERVLESGEEAVKIIMSLSAFVVQLFMFNTHIKLTGIADSKAILGYKLPPHIEQERFALCKMFKKDDYEKIIRHLMKTELLLKSSKGDKESILHSSLIKLQTFL